MRIGICENEQPIREQLIAMIEAYPIEESTEILAYAQGEAMLADVSGFDIAFLDIDLGEGINGLAVAQTLQSRARKVLVVFVSAHPGYISEAMVLAPFQYLLKPLDSAQFVREFARCLKHYRGDRHYFTIHQYGEEIPLPIANILYIAVEDRKLKVYVKGRPEPYEAYGRLKDAEKELLPRYFVLCNKGCLINLRFVDGAISDQVCLTYLDEKQRQQKILLPVSRRRHKEVIARMGRYVLDQGEV